MTLSMAQIISIKRCHDYCAVTFTTVGSTVSQRLGTGLEGPS